MQDSIVKIAKITGDSRTATFIARLSNGIRNAGHESAICGFLKGAAVLLGKATAWPGFRAAAAQSRWLRLFIAMPILLLPFLLVLDILTGRASRMQMLCELCLAGTALLILLAAPGPGPETGSRLFSWSRKWWA